MQAAPSDTRIDTYPNVSHAVRRFNAAPVERAGIELNPCVDTIETPHRYSFTRLRRWSKYCRNKEKKPGTGFFELS